MLRWRRMRLRSGEESSGLLLVGLGKGELTVVVDKIISLYQGRPVSFDEEQLHVPHRFLDMYEEQELWTPYAFPNILRYPGAPARAISTFTAFCSLSVIMVCLYCGQADCRAG